MIKLIGIFLVFIGSTNAGKKAFDYFIKIFNI